MKEKIIASIKAKFPAVNLSKARLDAIAAILEKKVTDENEIDAKLDEFNEYNPLADIAKQDDAMRNMQNKLKTAGQQNPTKNNSNDNQYAPGDPIDDDKDTPPWAKALMKSNNVLLEKVQQLEGEKTKSSIQKAIADKLKEIPGNYWNKRAIPQKEDDIDQFVIDVQADYADFQKELVEQGIAVHPAPVGGSGSGRGKGEKAASKEEIDAVVNEIM